MAQNKKKISKALGIRYQYIRRKIKAEEFEFDTGTSATVTYPRYTVTVVPETIRDATGKRINTKAPPVPLLQFNTGGTAVSPALYGGTVVSPVLYSLEYRKAWKKIAEDYNNRS